MAESDTNDDLDMDFEPWSMDVKDAKGANVASESTATEPSVPPVPPVPSVSQVDEIHIESSANLPTPEDVEDKYVSVTSGYDQAVDRLLAQVVNLNADNILHEPTCVICNNPHREEIEQKWADTNKDYTAVKTLMRDKCSISRISKSAIQNHMVYHVDREIREIQKIEYINRIKRLNSFNLSTMERIRLGMSAITERLMGVNSIVPDSDTSASDIEKIKTMETSRLMSSMNQLLKLQAEILGEMKSSGELVAIPRDDFIRIFNEAIIEADNDMQRDVIKDILSKLAAINKASQ